MILEGSLTGNLTEVTSQKGQLVSKQSRGNSFMVSSATGVIAAALAANSSVFAMRLDPGAGNIKAYITKIRFTFTCIVAFTVPITANRRLAIFRGSGAQPSGGTGITLSGKKNSTSADSEMETAQGGDMRISTTGALTVTGITFEAQELGFLSVVHAGTAGAFAEETLDGVDNPIVLQPGQVLAIRNPVVMDAAGTWQLAVAIEWYEENSVTL